MKTENTARKAARTYRDIREDYVYNDDIFNPEPERVRRCKEIIANELAPADRVIITLYAELGSLRKLGRLLGVSHTTAAGEVRRIRNIIFEKLAKDLHK